MDFGFGNIHRQETHLYNGTKNISFGSGNTARKARENRKKFPAFPLRRIAKLLVKVVKTTFIFERGLKLSYCELGGHYLPG